jgi:hypothetical protein
LDVCAGGSLGAKRERERKVSRTKRGARDDAMLRRAVGSS